jgi:hypothetical protein
MFFLTCPLDWMNTNDRLNARTRTKDAVKVRVIREESFMSFLFDGQSLNLLPSYWEGKPWL